MNRTKKSYFNQPNRQQTKNNVQLNRLNEFLFESFNITGHSKSQNNSQF